MDNIIHMDEKWFNTTSMYRKYYMLPEEDDPHRTVQNMNFIGKVMFSSAVGRPIYDDAGNYIFYGKLGVWPFVRKVHHSTLLSLSYINFCYLFVVLNFSHLLQEGAKRRSRNRGRGAQVTKPIKVDRTTMRSFLIGKVLKAIVQRWPREHRGKTIYIQQDNAPSHVPVDDEEFARVVAQTGMNIQLVNQPANSPDLNVLDLGFFASLQSLTYERVSRNLDELIQNVQNEFDNYDPDTLNRVFLTLQRCLIEVMKDGGGNRYKIPHIDKGKLEALGMLPKSLSCDRQLYEKVMKSLDN
jgi:hypothetical protein